MKTLIICLSLLSFSLGYAQEFENFNKRFKVVRDNEGKISHIKAKGVLTGFHFMPYVEGLKNDLIALKKDLLSKSQKVNMNGQLESEIYVDQILKEIEAGAYLETIQKGGKDGDSKKNAEQRREYLRKAYLNLPSVDINAAFDEIDNKGVFKKIGELLKKFYLQRNVDIIAAPEYKTFFYEQKVANRIASEALKFARSRLGALPILNIASFIINDLLVKIEEQREIAQNIFLYYIVNYENELKFTKDETNMIVSSVYESRIPLSSFQTSREAKNNWLNFGWSMYDKYPRTADARMRNQASEFISSSKLDFVFYEVVKGEDRMIVNAAYTEHMFSQSPSISFQYDKPNRIRTLRTLVRLGQMAIGFVPQVPGFIKNAINSFSYSWYKEQSKLEAFLYAHFESKKDEKMMEVIGSQISNPFFLF